MTIVIVVVLGIISIELFILIKGVHRMTVELDRLTASVTAEEGQVDSLITLVTGLSALIKASVNDPAALTALADSLDAKSAAIAAAVAANPLPGTTAP